MVSLGVTEFLPQTLHGLASQRTPPDAVLVVDVTPGPDPGHGRTSAVRSAAQEAGLPLERVRVAHAPAADTFGDAVRHGMRQLADQGGGGEDLVGARWLWLLHDDSAPEGAALAELLRAAKSGPTVAVTGAKQRDWDAPERLLELGVSVSRTGRRFLGLEDGELDQGQHDNRVDVYGVGTAGALVLTSVWHELDGTDPALGPFGDGLDLCRRARLAGYRVVVAPRAVVRHARAGYRGLRPTQRGRRPGTATADVRRSFRARRVALLHTRSVHAARWALPLLWCVVLVGLPVRVLARIVTKEFRLAGDEIAAVVTVLSRPRAVLRARGRARRQQRLPARRLRPLMATTREAWRVSHERRMQAAAARRGRLVRSELELVERAALAERRRWTLTAVVSGLVALAGVGLVHLLAAGALTGGALLPLSADLGSLWQRAVGAWSATGDGYAATADPFVYVLAGLAAVAGGSAQVAITALVVAAIPLAGVGAWFAAGAATRSLRLRSWASVVWAVAPPLVLALGQGRLGPVVAHLALPWVALGVARALGVHRGDEPAGTTPVPRHGRPGSVAAAAAAGLALAVATAGAPALLVPALVVLILLAGVAPRRRAVLLLVAVPPVALLAPLLVEAAADVPGGSWRVLFADPGLPLGYRPGSSIAALLGWPTDPVPWPLLSGAAATLAPVAAGAILLLGAALALLRHGRVRTVRAGWSVLAVGLATAVVAARVEVGLGTGVDDVGGVQVVHGWAGPGTSLVVLGAVVAVLGAADGLLRRLASSSFGWRQVSAAALAVLLVLGPLTGAIAWAWQAVEARDSGGPTPVLAVTGRGTSPVPALGRELQRAPQEARVLSLQPSGDELSVRIWRGDGDQLDERAAAITARALDGPPGSSVVTDPDAADADLAELVAGLALGGAGDPRTRLAGHGVAVVVVPPGSGDARDRLVARLDATSALERVTENSTGVVWRVVPERSDVPVARARVHDADGRPLQVLASRGVLAHGLVERGEPGRLVVLAERADPGWRAWVDGRPLPARSVGWQQAFALPTAGGDVTVTYTSWPLTLVHSAQAVVLGLFAVLALPLRRRRAGVS